MRKHGYEVLIAGSGLAALAAAARLVELGMKRIGIFAPAYGGTPYIAAINFVLPGNPFDDSPERYRDDMLEAGYYLNDTSLVERMTGISSEGYDLLRRWGVEFAHDRNGSLIRRHASGSSRPRSLCSTEELIGTRIVKAMMPRLKDAGVDVNIPFEAVGVVESGGHIAGFTFLDSDGNIHAEHAPVSIAAWGGVGTLLGQSTYPSDVDGRTLGMAFQAGVNLSDLEFLEYEPMVVLDPPGAFGEPCPTAMLGEGAYLLNAKGERFLLEIRPQGEAGAPKSLINKAIWKEVEAGRGSEHGGVFVDLRHIDPKVVRSYPWFSDRLVANGVDPCGRLVEVGPVPHSYSGGIRVDTRCESSSVGLYAIGEAAAGFNGACRMAGNAASQAVLSGIMCAESISSSKMHPIPRVVDGPVYNEDREVRTRLAPVIAHAAKALGIYRNGDEMGSALEVIESTRQESMLQSDTFTAQRIDALALMLTAALARNESRGTHTRTDFPLLDMQFARSTTLHRGSGGEIVLER